MSSPISLVVDQFNKSFPAMRADAAAGEEVPTVPLQYPVFPQFGQCAKTLAITLTGEKKVAFPSLNLSEMKELLDKSEGKTPTEEEETKKPEDTKPKDRGPVHRLEAGEKMVINFNSIVWDKIKTWVDITTEEISGLGCVRRLKDNTFDVYDIFLLQQDNTSSFTDIDDDALHALMWELQEKDDEDNGSRMDDLRFWWHSHASMDVFWSATDEGCIQSKLDHADWWLSAVLNRRGKILTRFDISNPPMRFDALSYHIIREIAPEIKEFCKKEYDKKVTEKTFNTYGRYTGPGYPEHGGYPRRTLPPATSWKDSWKKPGHAPGIHRPHTVQKPPGQESSFTLYTTEFSQIPDPQTRICRHINPAAAREIYKGEIDTAKAALGDLQKELGLGTVRFLGHAFDPRIKYFGQKPLILWTISGQVTDSDRTYMATVYADEPTFMHVSEIETINHRSPSGIIVTSHTLRIPETKFAEVGLDLDPDLPDVGSTTQGPEAAVGIIFATQNSWPDHLLGDLQIEDEVDEEESRTGLKRDSEQELISQVRKYAKASDDQILILRAEGFLRLASHSQLVNTLEHLADECAQDADEQEFRQNAQHMGSSNLHLAISSFIERDPVEGFVCIWNMAPYDLFCPGCFEPMAADEVSCAFCGIKYEPSEVDND